MAPSFDCAVSSLLCAEDDNSIFYDNDYFGGDAELEEFEATWNHRFFQNLNQNRVLNGVDEDGLPLQSEECLALMVEKEYQHLPNVDYLKRLQSGDLDLEARKEAVDWIWKVHAYYGFGPLCAYLSINYLDRFLSAYELPKGKAWMMQLLAVACLSLAAKKEETEVPLILDLQVGESKFMFEARTIQRMELLVLSTLNWRMQAITPFSFMDYFFYKLNDDKIPLRSSILRSTQLISSTIKGIDFLEFKPSEIAAAVAISVAVETRKVDTDKAISVLTQHVQKERVLKCVELVHDLSLVGGSVKERNASDPSVPQSPIGVLDAACLSYKSDDTTVGSCANSSHTHTSPNTKRRKMNRPYEVEL
ncbi:cyclin-D4-1-like [Durio zibethinus]|uniref:Cyclin-D4-1-like n=1 Tax=Durio zibethinus TaxID=66656 RepID=A0A6P6B551_DURZI|nr:cyclin-D4-1-like [Durio zibethinus]